MRTVLRWILSVVGYGAYTLVVLVLLLWFLFPAESFQGWLESQLEEQSGAVGWEIGELRIAWPLSLVVSNIRAVARDSREPLLTVDELKVLPNPAAFGRVVDEWPLLYRARTLDGLISGDLSLAKKDWRVNCSGKISKVMVDDLDSLWKQLGRKGGGSLSGSFTYEGEWPVSLSDSLQADLDLENGSLELLQPVFGLEELEFNRLTTSLSLAERVVTFEEGKVESHLFAADFSGTVTLADSIIGSGLDIQGSFEPRPELLGGLKDPAVVELIKGQLRENRLTFSLTDTLMEPGLLFEGVSGVIDGMIQGSGSRQ